MHILSYLPCQPKIMAFLAWVSLSVLIHWHSKYIQMTTRYSITVIF